MTAADGADANSPPQSAEEKTDARTALDLREPGLEITRANGVLKAAGVRLMKLDGVPTIGIWSDLDGPEIRTALKIMGSENCPVRYLDGDGIPAKYKVRVMDED